MKKVMSLLMFSLFAVSVFAQKVLVNDPAHSRIQFSVIHLTISDISGNFETANLTINADEKNFLNSKLTFEVDVNSINTHIEARDNHLRSADFLDVAKYPKMMFTSTAISKAKQKNYYNVKGNLSMHGITKPVSVVLVYRGSTVNQMNKKKTYGYQVLATVKRSDFNVGPGFPEAVISDQVRIKGDFELTEK
ncbi:MAG: YceI family protein [Weeksellaceae bacterium]|nr:YceI family protein [Weeksellaceae bacterium]